MQMLMRTMRIDPDALTVYYFEFAVGLGVHSPWHAQRLELHARCLRHLELSKPGAVRDVDHVDAPALPRVHAALRALPKLAGPENAEARREKLYDGLEQLELALRMNDRDVTLHHDLAQLLSHADIACDAEAIAH